MATRLQAKKSAETGKSGAQGKLGFSLEVQGKLGFSPSRGEVSKTPAMVGTVTGEGQCEGAAGSASSADGGRGDCGESGLCTQIQE